MEQWWNDTDRGKTRNWGRNLFPLPFFPTEFLTGNGMGSNPGFRGDRPATNRLNKGTAPTECSNTYVNKLGNICITSEL